MEDDFDIGAAVDDIGGGLGFELEAVDDDLTLDVEAKVVPDAAEAPALEAPAADAPATDPAATPAAIAEDPLAIPPKTWRKEAAAHWAALPAEARAEIAKREDDIFRGIEAYKTDATFGKSIKDVLAPYEPAMRQHGVDPMAQISNLMRAHHTLALGTPEAKAKMFQELAVAYGIQPEGEAPYLDPAVKTLQTELAAVRSQLTTAERARQAEVAAAHSKQVDAFASDTKNVYFNEVADQMATLLQKGVVGTLQEAYDKAVWLNPDTRAKEVARTSAEAAKAAATEAAAKLAATKRATAANVRTSAKSGSATTPLGSIDDTLAEALAAIKARG